MKKNLGEKNIRIIRRINCQSKSTEIKIIYCDTIDSNLKNEEDKVQLESYPDTPFIEITPLNYEIDNSPQKDLSSVPISEIDFPRLFI